MFVALRRPNGAVQPPADADLCIGAEGCVPSTFKAANGAEQAHHTFLEEVLAVPSRQKQRTGTGAHHAAIALDQGFLRGGVSRPGQKAYFLVRHGLEIRVS